MKTLDEHNQIVRDREARRARERMTGYGLRIACPDCKGGELWNMSPGMVNASNPPSIWATCNQCGARHVVLC